MAAACARTTRLICSRVSPPSASAVPVSMPDLDLLFAPAAQARAPCARDRARRRRRGRPSPGCAPKPVPPPPRPVPAAPRPPLPLPATRRAPARPFIAWSMSARSSRVEQPAQARAGRAGGAQRGQQAGLGHLGAQDVLAPLGHHRLLGRGVGRPRRPSCSRARLDSAASFSCAPAGLVGQPRPCARRLAPPWASAARSAGATTLARRSCVITAPVVGACWSLMSRTNRHQQASGHRGDAATVRTSSRLADERRPGQLLGRSAERECRSCSAPASSRFDGGRCRPGRARSGGTCRGRAGSAAGPAAASMSPTGRSCSRRVSSPVMPGPSRRRNPSRTGVSRRKRAREARQRRGRRR